MNKTGETCQKPGYYKFSGHTDSSINCHPTSDERDIPMKLKNTFPPIRSCEKGAFWKWDRPLWKLQ